MRSKITIERKWRQQSEAAKTEAEKLPHGKERDALMRKVRQLKTASQINRRQSFSHTLVQDIKPGVWEWATSAANLLIMGKAPSRPASWTRRQSSPSSSADNCAADRRITPSSIFGQRKMPSSRRLGNVVAECS
jgi:hypothetical protein